MIAGLRYVNPVSISSREDIELVETVHLRSVPVGSGAQRWEFQIMLEPVRGDGDLASALEALLFNAGQRIALQVTPPQRHAITAPSAVRLSRAEVTGDTEIRIDSTGAIALPAGTFFTLGTARKLYRTRVGAVANANQDRTIGIFPALVANAANNVELHFDRMWIRLTGDVQIKDDARGMVQYTLAAVEDLE